MYFWDVKNAERELRTVGEKSKSTLNYILGTYFVSQLTTLLFGRTEIKGLIKTGFAPEFTYIAIIVTSIVLLIMKFILTYFYNCNGAQNGKNFAYRLLVLTWVYSFHLAFFSAIVIGLFFYSMQFFFFDQLFILATVIIGTLLAGIYIVSGIGGSLKRIAW